MGSMKKKKTSRTSSFLYFYMFHISILFLFCLWQFEWSSRLQNKRKTSKAEGGEEIVVENVGRRKLDTKSLCLWCSGVGAKFSWIIHTREAGKLVQGWRDGAMLHNYATPFPYAIHGGCEDAKTGAAFNLLWLTTNHLLDHNGFCDVLDDVH